MSLRRRVGASLLAATIASMSIAAGAAEEEAEPAIDPAVRELVERMGKHMDSVRSFRIVAEAISDEIDEETGSRLQFGSTIEATLERPNHLRITHRTAGERQELFYDGATLTLYDVEQKVYGSMAFKGTVGSALQHAHDTAGVVPPLADLLYERPGVILMEHAAAAVHLGQDLVGGTLCEHLAFREENVDWQVWIEAGERPVPRKLVITSRDVEGHPQFGAQIHSFEDNPTLPPGHFHFTPPKDAERIEFLPVAQGRTGVEVTP